MAVGVGFFHFIFGIVLSSGYLWGQRQVWRGGWATVTMLLSGLWIITTIFVGWGVLHAGGQREAGLLQRVLAAASTGGRGRSSRRPFLCVEFTNLSSVVGADAYRGRELLLPVMGESAPQLGRGREHAVADGQRERAPVGPAGSPVGAGGLPQVR